MRGAFAETFGEQGDGEGVHPGPLVSSVGLEEAT